MDIGLALIFGVLYRLATNRLWYGTLYFIRQPLVLAVPIGLIMGNPRDAVKIGVPLQMTYLGAIAPGGTLPADEALIPRITTPAALAAGLEPDITVTITASVKLPGVLLDNLKHTYHSYFVHLAGRAVGKGDMKAVGRAEFWYPLSRSIPLHVLPTILVLLSETDAVSAFLNVAPARAMNGLSVVGGLLPAFDFAVTIMVIGKKEPTPYFILGFVMYVYTGINTIGIMVVAICIVILQSRSINSTDGVIAADDDEGNFWYE